MFNPFNSVILMNNGDGGTYEDIKYNIIKQIDENGILYYQLTESINSSTPTMIGDKIQFSAENLQFDNKNTIKQIINELVKENSEISNIIAQIQEQLQDNITITTFEELNIDTQDKTLNEIISEINDLNLTNNVIIQGLLYQDALPQDTELVLEDAVCKITTISQNGDNIYKIEATSDKVFPYTWTAIYKNNEMIMNWTSPFDKNSNSGITIEELKETLLRHIEDQNIHVTEEEKNSWNEKVNVSIEQNENDLTLTFLQ